jgi:hypothetical protein
MPSPLLAFWSGGNPDPTRTHGKDAKAAKELELAGWDYARPLKGRLFACLVHGDVEGPCSPGGSIAGPRPLVGIIGLEHHCWSLGTSLARPAKPACVG